MRAIPLFLSPTFHDFHLERDLFRRKVVRALDQALAAFDARIELIDLRWGVETGSATSLQAAEQKVIEVCLREIVRSRPLFVGCPQLPWRSALISVLPQRIPPLRQVSSYAESRLWSSSCFASQATTSRRR
jgi:hypothetical protein